MGFIGKLGLFLAALVCLAAAPAQVELDHLVVRVVVFESPTCHFCQEILKKELPPLIQRFGDQLQILYIDVETPAGREVYQAALHAYGVRGGVPLLFAGETVLSGVTIPARLPGLVDIALMQDGLDWPPIPGLEEYRASLQPAEMGMEQPAAPVAPPAQLPEAHSVLTQPGPTPQPVVRAVMFWSETCGHCHFILEEVLPPLQERYGARLEITLIELQSAGDVDRLYQTAAAYGVPKDNVGVPLLIVGEYALTGSVQIPEELPAIIERYLEQGGVDYPALEALADVLPERAAAGELQSEVCNFATPCPEPLPAAQAVIPPSPVGQTGGSSSGEPDQASRVDGFAAAVLALVGLAFLMIFVTRKGLGKRL